MKSNGVRGHKLFTFHAWASDSDVGNPTQVASIFDAIYQKNWPGQDGEPDVQFHVVDLRPLACRPDQVENFADRLANLLLAKQKQCHSFSNSSRLLFVGGARTLATREKECNAIRSIKQDVEFYIRTLQNYGVAHYAGIGGSALYSDQTEMSILSALIGISRYYCQPGTGNPASVRMNDRLNQVNADFKELVASARGLPAYKYLGSADVPNFDSNNIEYLNLLREIGVTYQLGKGDRLEQYSPAYVLSEMRKRKMLTFDASVEHSSYDLYAGLLGEIGNWAEAFHASAVARDKAEQEALGAGRLLIADQLANRSFKLSRYELLRDFGRVLGQGTMQRFREIGSSQPILLIDDEVHKLLSAQGERTSPSEAIKQGAIIRPLVQALASVGRQPDSVHVVPSAFVDAHIGLMQANGISALLPAEGQAGAMSLEGTRVGHPIDLGDYIGILIDPESRHDPCGPVRVQRLHGLLKHRLGPVQGASQGRSRRFMPPLLAYSRKESSGYVQQCLNMGASAFVPKTRPYQLLFALSRALRDERREHRHDGQASQFRILKTLKPHVAAKLLRKSGPTFIHGGLTNSSGEHIEDPREARWIRNLPKADLHYHFGTAIPCNVVEVLAMNTAGYFLAGAPDVAGADLVDGGAGQLLRKFASTLALVARLERLILGASTPLKFSRMEVLAAAAWAVRPGKPMANSAFGLGDAIVRHLVEPNDRCDEAHATALLVAMMASRKTFLLDEPLLAYFERLGSLAEKDFADTGETAFEPEQALAFEMRRAYELFNRVACRWNGSCTQDDFDVLAQARPTDFWRRLRNMVEGRVHSANARLRSCLDRALASVETNESEWLRALDWLRKNSLSLNALRVDEPRASLVGEFSLEHYVAVPDVTDGRGLQIYLRGADLMGSSHLQYPENLWIAALAITRDNADQNIVYSEVRCEATGYTKAGMGAHDATEILRCGFNLASLYVSGLSKPGDPRHVLPLVRTNILLAAKRHKTEPEARSVINLLDVYLERRAPVADAAHSRRAFFEKFGRTVPPWWRPCDVVGFDLSGDESQDKHWLKTVILPLAARSSHVTIHAGEAASAESIWRAVYELNALRIGHGLRLSEDSALLGYCVREGICMEFCPNSNRYTNQLNPHPRRDLSGDHMTAPLRYEYPLLHYLSHGMEVTIGTDNRYLHRREQRTLTSEYLTAAELVGGLTRWEVLQVVKAGFKNAFLDKAEVSSLIGAVEEEIYRIVATDYE